MPHLHASDRFAASYFLHVRHAPQLLARRPMRASALGFAELLAISLGLGYQDQTSHASPPTPGGPAQTHGGYFMSALSFRDFFAAARGDGRVAYPYQERLACGERFPELLDVPTGLGKTAGAGLMSRSRRLEIIRFTERQRRQSIATPFRNVVAIDCAEHSHINGAAVLQPRERWITSTASLQESASMGPQQRMLMRNCLLTLYSIHLMTTACWLTLGLF